VDQRDSSAIAGAIRLNRLLSLTDNWFMKHYDLICIGCGPAGEKAATQAAYFKRRVAVIESESRPGGAMVNTGTIPSKTLRETALLLSAFRRRSVPGIGLKIDRNISIFALMARMLAVQQVEHDRIESAIDRHAIDVISGRGRIIDPHTVRITDADGGERDLHAQHILIATGSRPTDLKSPGYDHPRIVDSDSLLHLDRLPRSLTVIGGGVIGCEYACVFGELGVEVTLIEPRDVVLGFLDEEIREALLRSMEEMGITVETGRAVDRIVAPAGDEHVCVVLKDGTEIKSSHVLYAAGRSGNTEGLGLENIGVVPNNRGYLTVDERYQTTCPGVYAAGDVIGFPALASTSMEQGRVAACRMFGLDYKKAVSDIFPIGLYTIPPIGTVGLTEEQARTEGLDVMTGRAPFALTARGRILESDGTTNIGFIKLVFEYPSRRLLGAQIIGDEATELIHIAQMVLGSSENDRTIDRFVHNVFNYPTLSETFRLAAVNGLQKIALREGRDDQIAARAKVA